MFPTFHHPPKPRTYPSTTTTTPPSSDLLGSQDTSLHHARRQRGPLRRQVFFSKEEEEEYERLKMERQQFEKDEMETKKSLTDDFLKGVCTTKCSRFEYLTRCVQQDIHPLEMENGRPKFENCVKKYQRSYAGASQHPNDLRPLDTLLVSSIREGSSFLFFFFFSFLSYPGLTPTLSLSLSLTFLL
ncbi:hypothetical protein HMI54_006074 [Coelomomyces lativittatus]|nr:hypothetical protein HMI54_006074 [Coelomomyces lativittatus]